MTHSVNREHLRKLIEKKCLLTDTGFTLSTGTQSLFYFDCKAATLDGECLSIIVDEVLDTINRFDSMPTAIGGLTMGADFIASAVVAKAYQIGHPTIHASIVRKEAKKHGTKNKIENQLEPGTKIVVIDDVITSGSSIKEACEEFIRAGYEIVGIVALIDRMSGGKEMLEKMYAPVYALFNRDDFAALKEQKDSTNVETRAAA
jgi:orotate phosphoribosyltransferase